MLIGVDKIMWVEIERLFGLIHARSRDHVSTWLRIRAGVVMHIPRGTLFGICVRCVMYARAYCCSEVAIVIESYYL